MTSVEYHPEHAQREKQQLRDRLSFERTRHAVRDLGMDPDWGAPIDAALQQAFDAGTLVEFPAGTYKITSPSVLRSHCGIVGLADAREDVVFRPPTGTSMRWLKFGVPESALLQNFTIDRRDDYETSVGMGGRIKRDVLVENVDYTGWTPSGPQLFAANVTDPAGVAIVDGLYRTGPTAFRRYPDSTLDIWSGRGHQGHMILRNIEIHNGSESGIYTGKGDGSYLIEDSYFENVVHTAIRGAGRSTTIRGCTVVMDTEAWDSRNQKVESTYDDGEPIQLNRAIWAQTNDKRFAGPVIEDCDVLIRNSDKAISGVHVNFDTGGAILRDVRLQVDDGRAVPVLATKPTGEAGEPLAMQLDGVHVSGAAWGRGAVTLEGRPNSRIEGSHLSGGGDGIQLSGSPGTRLEATTVAVDGETDREGDDGGPALERPTEPDVLPSERERTADRPESGTGGDESDGETGGDESDGETGGDDGEAPSGGSDDPLPYRLVVKSLGGGVCRYVAAAAEIRGTPAAEGTVVDGRVADRVGPERGVDEFEFQGPLRLDVSEGAELAAFFVEGDGVDGRVRIDPSTGWTPPSEREDDESRRSESDTRTLRVEGPTEESSVAFHFRVEGDVVDAPGSATAYPDGWIVAYMQTWWDPEFEIRGEIAESRWPSGARVVLGDDVLQE
ncbi:hypothetical protein SAMN04487947_1209 [Halogeometricum rufum]|uniref:Right handed beta helix region n=1 Tax=Halogeometricum rufum TaxID=553469 RepID=A0A1I6GIG1_9EURY|nr:hypothetical protein [Halogeometricum rufum]SFR41985.1 hypothetical protein SAMN04487947_1209 [Halogeometricum rufum]